MTGTGGGLEPNLEDVMDIVERLRGTPSIITALEAATEIERLRNLLQNGSPVVEGTIQHMAMEIMNLKKERDELVADARRYRWFRNHCPTMYWTTYEDGSTHLAKVDTERRMDFDTIELDAAIDAALAKSRR